MTVTKGTTAIQFAILGPARAWARSGEINFGAPQPRLMAALLLVRAGRVVRTDEFIDVLWGDAPPARSSDIVHRHIGGLRRSLEPHLAPRDPGVWLERKDDGYRFCVDADNLDLLSFRELVAQARQAEQDGNEPGALKLYTEALDLWTDRCAAGLHPSLTLGPEFDAVDRERATATCAAADIAVALGDVTDILPMLRRVAEQDPLDESLQARLLLVLAAAGRQAEAVAVHETVRAQLADGLGVDPGAELKAAYGRVLRQDVSQASSSPVPSVVPAQVPQSTRFFYGRQAELSELSALLPRTGVANGGVLVTIDGLPGIGKTCLAVHWAHKVAAEFPDGQLYLNLRGFNLTDGEGDSDLALIHLIAAFGLPHAEIPTDHKAKMTLYRSLTQGRRILVLLDNAQNADQVRPLVPTTAGSLVLVTSRVRLDRLVVDAEGHSLTLDLPTLEEARAGLQRRIGAARTAGEADALDEILRRCGRLPLATSIVAAQAVTRGSGGLRGIVAELSADTLDAFEGDEPGSDLRTVFSWSYHLLSPRAARLFRLLSVHPGTDFGPASAASLLAATPEETLVLLHELTATRLLSKIHRQRYLFHDLIRTYAAELAQESDSAQERRQAADRVVDHYWQSAHAANRRLQPGGPLIGIHAPLAGVTPEPITSVAEAFDWFASELRVLPSLAASGAWPVIEAMMPYFQRRGMHQAWDATSTQALEAAVAMGDVMGQAHMHRMVAGGRASVGDLASAVHHLHESLQLFEQLDREVEQAYVHTNLGWVRNQQHQSAPALDHYRTASALFGRYHDHRGTGVSLLGQGYVHLHLGELDIARTCLERASVCFDDLADADGGGRCADAMADVLLTLQRPGPALEQRVQALELFDRAGNIVSFAQVAQTLGEDQARQGLTDEARASWEIALRALHELGEVDRAAELRARLEQVIAGR